MSVITLKKPWETKEQVEDQNIQWRMQDIFIRTHIDNPRIQSVAEKIKKKIKISPHEGERMIMLEALCQEIFNQDLEKVKQEAVRVLKSYRSNGEPRKTLLISSASSASASWEAENNMEQKVDIPGAIEGRDVRCARVGDTALISTEAGLSMAKITQKAGIIDLANETIATKNNGQAIKGADIYYKSDALILLILSNPESETIQKLLKELKEEPLVHPYNLDEETQIAILWLTKKAGLDHLDVNANSPEVAVELTRKGHRYPTVEGAATLCECDNPHKMQKLEWELSQAAQEINFHPDSMPGYVIHRGKNKEDFSQKIQTGCELMSRRYELNDLWIKPDRGTDGGSQFSLSPNKKCYDAKIKKMWENKEVSAWVLEPKIKYFSISLPFKGGIEKLETALSVHVIRGRVRDTISLQFVHGTAWGGNIVCDQKTWTEFLSMLDKNDDRVDPSLFSELESGYKLAINKMKEYVMAVNKSEKYKDQQVRGGWDVAIGTLGGKFGDQPMMIWLDNNARANGCETAYACYDQANIQSDNKAVVTKNITPKINFRNFSICLPGAISKTNAVYDTNISPEQVELIAVSAGWGQIAMIGTNTMKNIENIILLEKVLADMNMIKLDVNN